MHRSDFRVSPRMGKVDQLSFFQWFNGKEALWKTMYLPIGSMGLVYFTGIGSCFNGKSVNVGKYTSSMDPMGNIPLRLRITIVSLFWRGGDVFHMIYKCIFEMYTNLLTQTQTSIFVTVPKVPFSKFWLLLCFPRNW